MPHNVVLIIVDGLAWRVVHPAMQQGRLPFFAAIEERGFATPCQSIYPSITPAATASLVTGAPPVKHGVQGAFWYDQAIDDVEYFGGAPRVMLREGLSTVVDDFVQTLNDDLLRVPTLYEHLAASGKDSANLNLMWRRGPVPHDLQAPLLLKLLPGVTWDRPVAGPDRLMLGDFISLDLPGDAQVDYPSGPLNRFGFNDQATLKHLEALLRSDSQSAVTVAYCPDNDFDSHARGPATALETVQQVDQALQAIARERGGLDAWLSDTAIIIVGDHGHDDLLDDADARDISVEGLFADEPIAMPGDSWDDTQALYVCSNMRSAQICVREERFSDLRHLASLALGDGRVDQAIWKNGEVNRFCIRTRDRGELRFSPVAAPESAEGRGDAADAQHVVDDNGRRWAISGSLSAVDADVDSEGRLSYGDYPDALQRIASGAPGRQAALWLTARPGCQFVVNGGERYQGGSHGSLHRNDSETVLTAAGVGRPASNPASITDVVDMCLAAVGAGRQAAAPRDSGQETAVGA